MAFSETGSIAACALFAIVAMGVLTSIFLVAGFVAGCGAGALAEVTVGVPGMLSPSALAFSVAIFYAPQNETKPQ